ncbi:hypothetical protein [Natrinema versiforme]|uniref:Uncharacterized protein n=1 Tax=Natrinema versiforme JCM 10478 TaxID=1227496 RepID=L9Y488_9EURY|nr:hypothetical protein [Natrinema versiforme]ELY68899.1 hypothetical protein C489_06018 [Natrinema versiforme JCM 10478]
MSGTDSPSSTSESGPEHVGGLDTTSELNAAFGWRLAFIPFAYVLIGLMYSAGYMSFNVWHEWLFVALIGLYTIIGPAEYLYHRRRIASTDS